MANNTTRFPNRYALMEAMDALFHQFTTKGLVTMVYETRIYPG